MDNIKLNKLPLGVQNYLPQECYNKSLLQSALLMEFSKWGYNQIEPSPLEFYDNFREGGFKIDGNKMCKFSDIDGSLVVLTPDLTMPIIKLATEGEISKYCYSGMVTYNSQDVHTSSRMQYQAGVEYLGSRSLHADIEVIALAIESLRRAGLEDFKIDMGHVAYFKGLLTEYDLDGDKIRQDFNRKNMLAVNMCLKQMNAGEAAFRVVSEAMTLFGSADVLGRAQALVKNSESLQAIEEIGKVYEKLASFGYEKYLSIDLGLAPRLSYYSGIVFSGLSNYVGAPVLLGGRYDKLGASFGKDIAATGFAIDIKKILIALEGSDSLAPVPKIDILAGGATDKLLHEYVTAKRAEGKRVSVLELSEAELKCQAAICGCEMYAYVSDGELKEVKR